MKWKRFGLPLFGAFILLTVCAGTLLAGIYNRSGTPESTLRMSERELELPTGNDFGQTDNSPLTLHLAWRVESPNRESSTPATASTTPAKWIDEAKLGQLGIPIPAPGGPNTFVSTLLALEFDGHAHSQDVSRACDPTSSLRDERACEFEVKKSSRLYVVDAGRTVAELRERYPDRTHYAIVPGVIRLSHEVNANELVGYVSDLSVDTVQGVEPLRSKIDPATGEMVWHQLLTQNYFDAVIAFGRRLEPWNASIDARGTIQNTVRPSDRQEHGYEFTP